MDLFTINIFDVVEIQNNQKYPFLYLVTKFRTNGSLVELELLRIKT